MTEERLQLLPEKFLREIAVKEGISFDDTTDKQELIDLIIEAIEEDRQENVLANNPAMHIKERKFDITLNEQFDFEEDQYPLPEQYNETRIMLLLRDPAWAYTYWDIKESDVAAYKLGAMKAELLLRVYELSEKVFSKTAVNDYFDIPVKFNDNSWYINLSSPGSYYTVELLLSGGTVKNLYAVPIRFSALSGRSAIQRDLHSLKAAVMICCLLQVFMI